jgi:hypothetical protein
VEKLPEGRPWAVKEEAPDPRGYQKQAEYHAIGALPVLGGNCAYSYREPDDGKCKARPRIHRLGKESTVNRLTISKLGKRSDLHGGIVDLGAGRQPPTETARGEWDQSPY